MSSAELTVNPATDIEQVANAIQPHLSQTGIDESVKVTLFFELFKQLAWLSSASIGAVVLILQLKQWPVTDMIIWALIALAISVLTSVLAQASMVSEMTEGKSLHQLKKMLTIMMACCLFLQGVGMGMSITYLLMI
jgi:hypothetical protein